MGYETPGDFQAPFDFNSITSSELKWPKLVNPFFFFREFEAIGVFSTWRSVSGWHIWIEVISTPIAKIEVSCYWFQEIEDIKYDKRSSGQVVTWGNIRPINIWVEREAESQSPRLDYLARSSGNHIFLWKLRSGN